MSLPSHNIKGLEPVSNDIYSASPIRDSEPTAFSPAYLDVLEHLEKAGVRYVVLHGWESLLNGTVSDLDLMVSSDDFARAESTLIANYKILNVFHYEASSFGFALSSRHNPTHPNLLVDISTDYRCRGLIFFTAEELIRSRRRWRDYWVAAQVHELEYLLIKKIYEKAEIPHRQRLRLEQLVCELGSPAAEASIVRLFGTMWGRRMITWINHHQWAQIETSIPQLQASLRREVLQRDSRNRLRFWWQELRRICIRWQHPSGLFIAISGNRTTEVSRATVDIFEQLSHVFRRLVVMETTSRQNSTAGPLLWLECIRRLFYYMVTFRILLRRSTLFVWEVNDCLPTGKKHRAFRFGRVLNQVAPRPDLSFTIKSDLTDTRLSHRMARQQVILNDAAHFSEEIRKTIEQYLSKRYEARRHVWVPYLILSSSSS